LIIFSVVLMMKMARYIELYLAIFAKKSYFWLVIEIYIQPFLLKNSIFG